MPVIDVASQHMLSARAHGGDLMDWTALVGGQRIAAGLQPFADNRVSSITIQVAETELIIAQRHLERYYDENDEK